MVPVARLVLLRSAPKDELVDALTTLTMPAVVGPILGPPLGGLIVTVASWRGAFASSTVPIAIIGVLLTRAYVPDIAEDNPAVSIRAVFILSALGLGGVVFGFQNLGRGILPLPVALSVAAIGAVAAWMFERHARETPNAIMDLSILKTRTFFTAVIAAGFRA